MRDMNAAAQAQLDSPMAGQSLALERSVVIGQPLTATEQHKKTHQSSFFFGAKNNDPHLWKLDDDETFFFFFSFSKLHVVFISLPHLLLFCNCEGETHCYRMSRQPRVS